MTGPDLRTGPIGPHRRQVLAIDPAGPVPSGRVWDRVVAAALGWGSGEGVAWRDAVVLLPSPAHAAALRASWVNAGGWVPRIGTPEMVAASLAGPAPVASGSVGVDPVADRLEARRRLRASDGLRAWVAADPRAASLAAGHVARLAQAAAHAAAACPPGQRRAWWAERLARVAARATADATVEQQLVRLALDWASAAPPPPTDVLFGWSPSAWVHVSVGIDEPLAVTLVANATAPALRIDLVLGGAVMPDAPASRDADGAARLQRALEAVGAAGTACAAAAPDLEHEALFAVAQVVREHQAGRRPVALVSTDRLVVRRAHALLVQHGAAVRDLSGWRLSTSRAAATVMAWLRAVRADASTDDALDALKHLHADVTAHRELETSWRRAGWRRLTQVEEAEGPTAVGGASRPGAAAAPNDAPLGWAAFRQARDEWRRGPREDSLPGWLQRLRDGLSRGALIDVLRSDEAGRAVVEALRLADAAPGASLRRAAADETFTEREFADWIDETLEASSFQPEPAPVDPDVVIVPLSRVALRGYGAVVIPGADERHLGGPMAPSPLLDDSLADLLGVPSRDTLQAHEAWALAWACAAASVTLLWRREDAGEALGPSPLLERLAAARERAGRGPMPVPEPGIEWRPAAEKPVQRGRAVTQVPWPQTLSATQLAALRQCPYRFHAEVLLRLREVDELDMPPDKRVFGEWLHACLHRFHAEGVAQSEADPESEVARLEAIGRETAASLNVDPDEFALFEAGLRPFAQRYLTWWRERAAAGWTWQAGELALEAAPPDWAPLSLRGRLDRVDRLRSEGRMAILDYKAGSVQRQRERVRDPGEDTQLLFYATLLKHAPTEATAPLGPLPAEDAGWEAAYVALDDPKGVAAVPHRGIGEQVDGFVQSIGRDLQRLREGAEARALGEGPSCDHCAVRGLCRRDHAVPEVSEPLA